jgi:hypothetical protein
MLPKVHKTLLFCKRREFVEACQQTAGRQTGRQAGRQAGNCQYLHCFSAAAAVSAIVKPVGGGGGGDGGIELTGVKLLLCHRCLTAHMEFQFSAAVVHKFSSTESIVASTCPE